MPAPRIEQSGNDPNAVLLWIKAVPGSSRDQIAGLLGDRLKIRVSAPAEGGKANQAVCEVLARNLKLKSRQVTIESGHSSPEKLVRIAGESLDELRQRIAGFLKE